MAAFAKWSVVLVAVFTILVSVSLSIKHDGRDKEITAALMMGIIWPLWTIIAVMAWWEG